MDLRSVLFQFRSRSLHWYLPHEDGNEDHHDASRVLVARVDGRHQSHCTSNLDPNRSVGRTDDDEGAHLEYSEQLSEQQTTRGPEVGETPATPMNLN